MDKRPEVIVQIGDMADMPSLCSQSRKIEVEGRRYAQDIASAHDALEKLHRPMISFNKRKQKYKEKQYRPRMVMTLGNHENRINNAVADNPNLEGFFSTTDLKYELYGWEVYPFLDRVFIEGIAFSHYFATGVSGRGISGENIGKTMCNKLHHSAVQGHSHIYDHHERTRVDGQKIFGLSCGCYSHPEQKEGWNTATEHMWWRGIVRIQSDGSGYYDRLETITLRELNRVYG